MDRLWLVNVQPQVIDKRMVKIYAWYDNEWGYSARLVDCALMAAASL